MAPRTPVRVTTRNNAFPNETTPIDDGLNTVYISPPIPLRVRTGSGRNAVTTTIQYVSVFDPATKRTEVYRQNYNLIGQPQPLERSNLLAVRGDDGQYEPTQFVRDTYGGQVASQFVNSGGIRENFDANRKYTALRGFEQETKTNITTTELARLLNTDPEDENPDDPDSGGNAAGDDGSTTATVQDISVDGLNDAIGRGQGSNFNKTGKSALTYPIEKPAQLQSDYVKFTALEYGTTSVNTSNFATSPGANSSLGKSVYLAIQGGISDSNGVGWNEEVLNPLQIAGARVAMTTMDEGVSAGINEIGEMVANATGFTGDLRKAIIASATESAIGANILPRTSRAIFNPNVELLFNGPQLRAFNFNFKMTPRSKPEADTVLEIVKFFKVNMAPKTVGSGLFLKAPNVFRVEYIYKDAPNHPGINLVKDCALQNCSVDYTPDGSYMTLPDGAMFSYNLTLSFMELLPIYQSDYDKVKHPIGF